MSVRTVKEYEVGGLSGAKVSYNPEYVKVGDQRLRDDLEFFLIFSPHQYKILQRLYTIKYTGKYGDDYLVHFRSGPTHEVTDVATLNEVINFIYHYMCDDEVGTLECWMKAIDVVEEMVAKGGQVPWDLPSPAVQNMRTRYTDKVNAVPIDPPGRKVDKPCPKFGCGGTEVVDLSMQTRSIDEGATQFIKCCKCKRIRTDRFKFIKEEQVK